LDFGKPILVSFFEITFYITELINSCPPSNLRPNSLISSAIYSIIKPRFNPLNTFLTSIGSNLNIVATKSG